MSQQESSASLLLAKQMKHLKEYPSPYFSVGLMGDSDLFRWEVMLLGPEGTPYEGGIFKAQMTFPSEFPLRPPTLVFLTSMWHPNIYADGEVCISILHDGEDSTGNELSGERWSPVQTVETILVSVMSILADPNEDSPANLEAAIEMRSDRAAYDKKVTKMVQRTIDDL